MKAAAGTLYLGEKSVCLRAFDVNVTFGSVSKKVLHQYSHNLYSVYAPY